MSVVEMGADCAIAIDEPAVSLAFRAVFEGWNGNSPAVGDLRADATGARRFQFLQTKDPGLLAARGVARLNAAGGAVNACYELSFPLATTVAQIGLECLLPADCLCATNDSGLVITNTAGTKCLGLRFEKPITANVLGGGRRIRLIFVGEGKIAAGTRLVRTFQVWTAEGLKADFAEPKCCRADDDWLPLPQEREVMPGSACDFSTLRGDVSPCGSHGRIVVRNAHFEFENRPGVPVRFYGVNLCSDMCFLESNAVDRLVVNLARAGYNSIRLHHFDRELTWGSPDATGLDTNLLARLDYLLKRCFDQGLYMTTDLFVNRRVPRKAVGVPGDDERIGQSEFKGLVYSNAALRENFKCFIRNFLGHVNAYTHRRYADEPGFFAVGIVNEGAHQLANETPGERRRSADGEIAFMDEMRRLVRDELGSKILLGNLSDGPIPDELTAARAKCHDYIDHHFYVDHPVWLGSWAHTWSSQRNRNPLRDPEFDQRTFASMRVREMPFIVTEFNVCAPNRYRAAAAAYLPALAAAEGWSGLWRFEWGAHGVGLEAARAENAERLCSFDSPGDPVMMLQEGLFAAMILRGDLTSDASAPVIDRKNGSCSFASSRSCGLFAESGRLRAGCLAAEIEGTPAAVWAISLDGEPLASSHRILLAHVTDVRATDMEYTDGARLLVMNPGKLPLLMRRGVANVLLALDQSPKMPWKVRAVSLAGRRIGEVPCEIAENGRLHLRCDTAFFRHHAVCLYELTRDERPLICTSTTESIHNKITKKGKIK